MPILLHHPQVVIVLACRAILVAIVQIGLDVTGMQRVEINIVAHDCYFHQGGGADNSSSNLWSLGCAPHAAHDVAINPKIHILTPVVA